MLDISDKADNTAGATGQLPASEFNDHKNEHQNSVTRSGQTLSGSDDIQQAKAMFINGVSGVSMQDGGSANAIQLSPLTGALGLAIPDTYTAMNGAVLSFVKSVANTSQTVVLSAGQTGTELGAKSVKRLDGLDPGIGEILGLITVQYQAGSDTWVILDIYNDSDVTRDGTDVRRWTSGESVVLGDIRSSGGLQYVCFLAHVAAAANKPGSQGGAQYWFTAGDIKKQQEDFTNGEIRPAGISEMLDRAGANYQQNIRCGQYFIDGVLKNVFAVAMDGTVVTGDTTLEDDIFGIGVDQYYYADKWLPDNAGTRTLKDIGDNVPTPQSSGGDADTTGDLVDDQLQGFEINISTTNAVGGVPTRNAGGTSAEVSVLTYLPEDDGVNGTPRTGSTTHGKRVTRSIYYLLVIRDA